MKMRGLFPSLGAGGSLIAAAVCALAVFGGVLAFRGESPSAAEANAGDVVVPDGAVRAVTTSSRSLAETVTTLVATGSEAIAADRRPRRARARVAPRRDRAIPRATNRGGTTPRPVTPATPAPSERRGDTSGGTPTPTPVPSAPTPEVPSGTVQRVVEQTRGAAQPIVDATPPAVQAPVQQVADTVEQVAGTVDQTVDGVTGLVLP